MLDATKRMRRRLASRLDTGEAVLAAVSLHQEGTLEAALSSISISTPGGVGPGMALHHLPSEEEGGDKAGSGVGSGTYLYLVLTSRRVLLVRRSAFGLARDVVFEAPLAEVSAITLKPSSHNVDLQLGGDHTLRFETPKAPKFLPEVYRQLPALLAEAKAQASPG